MRALTTFLRDLFGLAGMCAITYGFYLGLGLPCALIVGGTFALTISILTGVDEATWASLTTPAPAAPPGPPLFGDAG